MGQDDAAAPLSAFDELAATVQALQLATVASLKLHHLSHPSILAQVLASVRPARPPGPVEARTMALLTQMLETAMGQRPAATFPWETSGQA